MSFLNHDHTVIKKSHQHLTLKTMIDWFSKTKMTTAEFHCNTWQFKETRSVWPLLGENSTTLCLAALTQFTETNRISLYNKILRNQTNTTSHWGTNIYMAQLHQWTGILSTSTKIIINCEHSTTDDGHIPITFHCCSQCKPLLFHIHEKHFTHNIKYIMSQKKVPLLFSAQLWQFML